MTSTKNDFIKNASLLVASMSEVADLRQVSVMEVLETSTARLAVSMKLVSKGVEQEVSNGWVTGVAVQLPLIKHAQENLVEETGEDEGDDDESDTDETHGIDEEDGPDAAEIDDYVSEILRQTLTKAVGTVFTIYDLDFPNSKVTLMVSMDLINRTFKRLSAQHREEARPGDKVVMLPVDEDKPINNVYNIYLKP